MRCYGLIGEWMHKSTYFTQSASVWKCKIHAISGGYEPQLSFLTRSRGIGYNRWATFLYFVRGGVNLGQA